MPGLLNTRARSLTTFVVALLAPIVQAAAQQPAPSAAQTSPATQPEIVNWVDEFDGERLDETKWELYTFQGGGGGKVEVKDKLLKMRGAGGSRSGVRSRQTFSGDRFLVEATLAKVGVRTPEQGEGGFPPGTAVLTVLFDGNANNRIEWLLRSDGIFEAWVSVDGRMERVDKGNRGTKEKNPVLGIGRRGEQILFLLNGEIGLEHTVRGMSSNFKVMLYGFGNTENHWDSIKVRTLKQ